MEPCWARIKLSAVSIYSFLFSTVWLNLSRRTVQFVLTSVCPLFLLLSIIRSQYWRETQIVPCLLVLSVWPRLKSKSRFVLWHRCQCSLLARGALLSFPVCGCKITTTFRRLQIFFYSITYFSQISSAIIYNLTESTNVKISFKILIHKIKPYSKLFTATKFSYSFWKKDPFFATNFLILSTYPPTSPP